MNVFITLEPSVLRSSVIMVSADKRQSKEQRGVGDSCEKRLCAKRAEIAKWFRIMNRISGNFTVN